MAALKGPPHKRAERRLCYSALNMAGVRRRLLWLACLWLSAQVAALAAVPVSMCSMARQAAEAPGCTCIHTANATCPMHHPAKSPSGCNCRGTSPDPGSLTVVSLLGPIAVLPDAASTLAPPPATQSPIPQIAGFSNFVAVPDGPPPRA